VKKKNEPDKEEEQEKKLNRRLHMRNKTSLNELRRNLKVKREEPEKWAYKKRLIHN